MKANNTEKSQRPSYTVLQYLERYFFFLFCRYNQNFNGDYCICHRPYPDPEDKVEDEMIQVIFQDDKS